MDDAEFTISVKRGSFMGENGFLADILILKTGKMRSFFSVTLKDLLSACDEALKKLI